MDKKEDTFFDKFGLGIDMASLDSMEVGETYPLYGMITKILSEVPGRVVAEINFSITANLNVEDPEKIELLKGRAFEPGIFVSTLKSKDDKTVVVDCSTVVFGRKQNYEA